MENWQTDSLSSSQGRPGKAVSYWYWLWLTQNKLINKGVPRCTTRTCQAVYVIAIPACYRLLGLPTFILTAGEQSFPVPGAGVKPSTGVDTSDNNTATYNPMLILGSSINPSKSSVRSRVSGSAGGYPQTGTRLSSGFEY